VICLFISCNESKRKPAGVADHDSKVREAYPGTDTIRTKITESIRLMDSASIMGRKRSKKIQIQAEIDFSGGRPNPYSCFYSPKVDQVMKGKEPLDLDSANLWKIMDQLNAKELLYFCTTYRCSYSQICSRFQADEKPLVHKYLPTVHEGYTMDYQQTVALRKKRKEVIELLIDFIEKDCFSYDDTFFMLIDYINGWELIPFLLKKDDGHIRPIVITLVFRFMQHDNYAPIARNPAYAKMYSGKEETSYPYSDELFDQVKSEALKYYQSQLLSTK